MKFDLFYRLSFYLMLFLATLALNIDATSDFFLAPLYPLSVLLASVIALLTVDRKPGRGIPRELANALALASVIPCIIEYKYDDYLLVLAMGHWLVYLQIIKTLMPKTVEDDWFLFLLGLTQVIVGSFQPGERIGPVLFLWGLAALWTLCLFHLRREADRTLGRSLGIVRPAPDPSDPYPGLIDLPFVLFVGRGALLTLLLGSVIFFLLPRNESTTRGRRTGTPVSAHLSGFSEEVQLGQMGEILESESVVMTVELYDEKDDRVVPTAEQLWRGVCMTNYSNRRWSRLRPTAEWFDPDETPDPRSDSNRGLVRQRIKLEPTAGEVLFALRPVLWAKGRDVALNTMDGTLLRARQGGRGRAFAPFNRSYSTYDYDVISSSDPGARQPREIPPDPMMLRAQTAVPADLRSRLQPVVNSILQDIPIGESGRRARALESYLRDSGDFHYTLVMDVQDSSIDPIADFLFNRKQGHCEYFASALAMLLRTAGIPARLINGFKGGDWNVGDSITVRQKHAHSWVEALVEPEPGQRRRWVSLDATPSSEREEAVAQVGGFRSRLRYLSDFFRYVWVFYVMGFDAERQNRLIYGPIKALAEDARRGFRLLGDGLRAAVDYLLDFPSLESFFSPRGFLTAVLALASLAILARIAFWIGRKIVRFWRPNAFREADSETSVESYRRLVVLLSQAGLHRSETETPLEFAHRSEEALAARGPKLRHLSDIPGQVVDFYYRVRYGGHSMDPIHAEVLRSRLDLLQEGLRPSV